RRSRVLSVSIAYTHESCLVLLLHSSHEQVACEERGSESDEQRIEPRDEAADAAPREPAWIEALAPEARVAADLEHADAVPHAVAPELVRRQMADVVRVGRAVRDVRPAPEQQPEPIAPVAAVRLHPDEGPATPEDAQALGD